MLWKDIKLKLSQYLENKPIFYKKIDFERFPRAYESVKSSLEIPPIIHIVGTNGKGSTGRFLAQILESFDFSVGHFTSPHIFEFRERFYKNGSIVSEDELENAHQVLQDILPFEFKNSLSYFEYATLLAAILFKNSSYVIFEAGMGGEYDSTNSFPKLLSLFTPISLDHTEILGSTLEKISITKLNAMSKTAILNDSMNEISLNIARDIALKKGTNLSLASENLTPADNDEISKYLVNFSIPKFLISNLTLACAAIKALNLELDLKGLGRLNLRGRKEQILPNLTVDVGHNEDAAKAILAEFSTKKVILIYNAFKDKDYAKILSILKPIIKEVKVYKYESSFRELANDEIFKVCQNLGIKCSKFSTLNRDQDYLVFGSFMLVEEFLKNENLH